MRGSATRACSTASSAGARGSRSSAIGAHRARLHAGLAAQAQRRHRPRRSTAADTFERQNAEPARGHLAGSTRGERIQDVAAQLGHGDAGRRRRALPRRPRGPTARAPRRAIEPRRAGDADRVAPAATTDGAAPRRPRPPAPRRPTPRRRRRRRGAGRDAAPRPRRRRRPPRRATTHRGAAATTHRRTGDRQRPRTSDDRAARRTAAAAPSRAAQAPRAARASRGAASSAASASSSPCSSCSCSLAAGARGLPRHGQGRRAWPAPRPASRSARSSCRRGAARSSTATASSSRSPSPPTTSPPRRTWSRTRCRTAAKLAPLLGVDEDDALSKLAAARHRLRLPRAQAARQPGHDACRSSSSPGIDAHRRRTGASTRASTWPAQVLGAVGTDGNGLSGSSTPTTSCCRAPTASGASSRTRSASRSRSATRKPAKAGREPAS